MFVGQVSRLTDDEKLTERITIRFTPEELKAFKRLAHEENERKVSALLRRILLAYLKKRDRNFGRNLGTD